MYKWLPFLLFSSVLSASEISIDVNDPVQKEGEIYTENGGIIRTENMRIQAKNLALKEVNGERIVTASGDLLIVYENKFFVGDHFVYNFTTKTGELDNGVSYVTGLFAGGKKIVFEPTGNLDLKEVFITTSDNRDYDWALHAGQAKVDDKYKVSASQVKFDVYKTPVFWFPAYSADAKPKYKKKSTLRYRMMWEKGQGPLFLLRYKAWDSNTLKVFLRGEYRLGINSLKPISVSKQGAGGAIEVDYSSPTKRQKLSSRNFYAYDTFYNDDDAHKLRSRYRIQGIYSGETKDKHIESFCRWDALSDKNMRQDFPTQLFELQTLERTEAFVKAKYDPIFASIYARPRINPFRGFMQELPTLKLSFKPYEAAGFIFDNKVRLAFLDYVYANNIAPNFHAGRFETKQSLYRPLQLGVISVTPKVNFDGIYYTNNPKKEQALQTVFSYSLDTHAEFYKSLAKHTHYVRPFITLEGMSQPKSEDVYVFSIRDGFHKLHECHFGVKNSFFSNTSFAAEPRFFCHLTGISFYDTPTFHSPVPKAHCHFGWNFPKLALSSKVGWNVEQNTLDFTNIHLGYTFNQFFAFSMEMRHRGKFDWRKNNHHNYILDVSRETSQLLESPLSDARTIFLARWELQIAPLWTLQIYNHLGWRPNQPFYHESKVDLYTLLSNRWKLRLSYMRTVRTNQFTFDISLI